MTITQEELFQLKTEYEAMIMKLKGLTEEELKLVTGGSGKGEEASLILVPNEYYYCTTICPASTFILKYIGPEADQYKFLVICFDESILNQGVFTNYYLTNDLSAIFKCERPSWLPENY